MVNPRNILINNAIGLDNDESSSSTGVKKPKLVDIFYWVDSLTYVQNAPSGSFGSWLNSLGDNDDPSVRGMVVCVTSLDRVKFNLVLMLSKIVECETSYFIQSLEKNPHYLDYIIVGHNDSFYGAYMKMVRYEELVEPTDMDEYP